MKSSSEDSHVTRHSNDSKHSFGFLNVGTLGNESNFSKRIIKESLFASKTNGSALSNVKFKLRIYLADLVLEKGEHFGRQKF
jgi:hypothetical protein